VLSRYIKGITTAKALTPVVLRGVVIGIGQPAGGTAGPNFELRGIPIPPAPLLRSRARDKAMRAGRFLVTARLSDT
jgi:hypothetical protein